MSIQKLLRHMVQSDKEGAVTNVTVTDNPAVFTSQLAEGFSRKSLRVYNNSDTGSGELYYGYAGSGEMNSGLASFPIKKGEIVKIDVATDVNVYFVAEAGEVGDLRVEELA